MNVIETLSIKNFCGINKADLNLAKFLVLIGPQSSGKSLVSKLIYWSRMSIANIYFEVQEGATYRDVIKGARDRFEDMFVLSYDEDFEMKYRIGKFSISVSFNQRKNLKLEFSEELTTLIKVFVKHVREKSIGDELEGPSRASFGRRESRKIFDNLVETDSGQKSAARWPIYAPAARSFFSQIEDSLFVFLASSKRLDPLIEGFGDYLRWAKESFTRNARKGEASPFLENLYSELLKGRYIRDQKQDYIEHPDGRKVPLSSASSGQQEILPLCLILNEMSRGPDVPRMFIVEEPEAHLHPAAQRVIVEAIVHASTASNGQTIITTHSPYVLSVLNNLYLAGKVNAERPTKYKDSTMFGSRIKPGDLSAYAMANGCAISLIDPETDLINADAIDVVSSEISADFDSLLNILY
jgi:predicted ATPase